MNRIKSRAFLASHAAEAWRRQYASAIANHRDDYDAKRRATYHALLALGPTPDPDEVDRIIGNGSWTSNHCDECGEAADTVQVGQPPDYESRTADLCEPCVRRALAEFEAVRRGRENR